jgi:DNA-binding NarL/FixJ family response regulator
MNKKIRILVIDDHPVVRQGVVAMIQEFGEKFQIVGQAMEPVEGIARAEALRPDIVVTDLMFSGSAQDGIDIVKALAQRLPDTRCVVITSNMQGHRMVDAFKAGAKAFLYKDSDVREYIRAIEAAFDGMTYFPPGLAGEMDKWNRLPKPTDAEKRLIPYVAKGLTSKEIAREYNHLDSPRKINSRTIDQHKSNIKQKFGIDSGGPGALVAFATKYCEDNNPDYKNLKIHTKR